jgi:hypothetical protein
MTKRAANEVESVTADAYVFDTLMHDLIGHDRSAAAFVVYLYLWRHSLGAGETTVQTSLRDIAEGTGFSLSGVRTVLLSERSRRARPIYYDQNTVREDLVPTSSFDAENLLSLLPSRSIWVGTDSASLHSKTISKEARDLW